MLIVTPGRLLKALNETFLLNVTPSKFVPRAVTRRFCVEIVHSKLGLCRRIVAKDVNLLLVNICHTSLENTNLLVLIGDSQSSARSIVRYA